MASVVTERTRRPAGLRTALVVLLAATASAYAALWLGGALEILTHEEPPDGPGCYVYVAGGESTSAIGTEADQWIGGGILGRPGRVCIVEPDGVEHFSPGMVPPSLAQDLTTDGTATVPVVTDIDALSALFAMLLFLGAMVGGAVSWRRRSSATT